MMAKFKGHKGIWYLTKGKKYEVIQETEHHCTVINDKDREVLCGKHLFEFFDK